MNETFVIAELGDKVDCRRTKLAADKIEVRIDPRAEWNQISIAWRTTAITLRPQHARRGLESHAREYSVFLPDVSVRQDSIASCAGCTRAVGRTSPLAGGDSWHDRMSVAPSPRRRLCRLHGRYRFAKVKETEWTPDLRAR